MTLPIEQQTRRAITPIEAILASQMEGRQPNPVGPFIPFANQREALATDVIPGLEKVVGTLAEVLNPVPQSPLEGLLMMAGPMALSRLPLRTLGKIGRFDPKNLNRAVQKSVADLRRRRIPLEDPSMVGIDWDANLPRAIRMRETGEVFTLGAPGQKVNIFHPEIVRAIQNKLRRQIGPNEYDEGFIDLISNTFFDRVQQSVMEHRILKTLFPHLVK